jgi:hypothetical protein
MPAAPLAAILGFAESDEQIANDELAGSQVDFRDVLAADCQVPFDADPRPAQADHVAQFAEGYLVGRALRGGDGIGIDAPPQAQRGPAARIVPAIAGEQSGAGLLAVKVGSADYARQARSDGQNPEPGCWGAVVGNVGGGSHIFQDRVPAAWKFMDGANMRLG